jgi:hypothetical protein
MHNNLDFHKCIFVDYVDVNSSLVPYANLVVALQLPIKTLLMQNHNLITCNIQRKGLGSY